MMMELIGSVISQLMATGSASARSYLGTHSLVHHRVLARIPTNASHHTLPCSSEGTRTHYNERIHTKHSLVHHRVLAHILTNASTPHTALFITGHSLTCGIQCSSEGTRLPSECHVHHRALAYLWN